MFKIGRYVRDISPSDSGVFLIQTEEQIKQAEKDFAYEAWTPRQGEWCYFYNFTAQQSARLARFSKISHGKGRVGQYKDQQGNLSRKR